MPTPFSLPQRGDWSARTTRPRRSVFGNYGAPLAAKRQETPEPDLTTEPSADPSERKTGIALALARGFVHRFLAQAFADPTPDGWLWLAAPGTRAALQAAVRLVSPEGTPLSEAATRLLEQDALLNLEEVKAEYVAVFGHAARGGCPLNEIEYGDLKADPLFQPHRLADLAAFYRAFGLEVTDDASERLDHVSLELEFMTVLCVKEGYALEHGLPVSNLHLGRLTQQQFLREHLGRWVPAFSRRLASASGGRLGALADFTRHFIELECQRQGVSAGSEDLMLRPVDDAAESLCATCNLNQGPTSALSPEPFAPLP